MGVKPARLPFQPVEELVRRSWQPRNEQDGPVMFGPAAIADRLHINRTTIHRWQHAGIPEDRADRVALQLGSHPAILWPAWYAEAALA